MTGENLRGWTAKVVVHQARLPVRVITHIRNDVWLVEGSRLPHWCLRDNGVRRLNVHRDDLLDLKAPR
jgi:hypothetical protein